MELSNFTYTAASIAVKGTSKAARFTSAVVTTPVVIVAMGIMSVAATVGSAAVVADEKVNKTCDHLDKVSEDLRYKGCYVKDLPVRA